MSVICKIMGHVWGDWYEASDGVFKWQERECEYCHDKERYDPSDNGPDKKLRLCIVCKRLLPDIGFENDVCVDCQH